MRTENVPLARTLAKKTGIGHPVPTKSVAKVPSPVYKPRKKTG
jgi:hypothetical protein